MDSSRRVETNENENNENKFYTTTPPKSDNYIFKYESKKKEVRGHKIAYSSLDEIKNLNIAKLHRKTSPEDNEGVRSGWIKFSNERNDKNLNVAQEAKWVLRFPKGDPAINDAWKKVVDLVEQDILWDVKASAQNDGFETQIICVYATEDKNLQEIVGLYDILLKNGLIDLHKQQSINNNKINFITDESTRLRNSSPDFTNEEIEDLHKLYELRETVSDEMYQKRWIEFEKAMWAKIKNEPLDPTFKRTLLSPEESTQRYKLVDTLNNFQTQNQTEQFPELNSIIKNLRTALVSNYKFQSFELIQHHINLLRKAKPNQNLLSSVFKKDQNANAFNDAIKLLNQLGNQESERLTITKSTNAPKQ